MDKFNYIVNTAEKKIRKSEKKSEEIITMWNIETKRKYRRDDVR